MNKIRLVALDMDGTSYFRLGPIVPENIEPIIKTQEKGVHVVFITGRPLNGPKNLFIENGFTRHEAIACGYNGALICDIEKNEVLAKSPISKEIVKKVFELVQLEKYKDVQIWGYSINDSLVYHSHTLEDHALGMECAFFKGDYKLITKDNIDDIKDDFYKLLIFECTSDYAKELENLDLDVAMSTKTFIAEVNKRGINKRYAVDFLCKKYNIKPDEILAIGDGKNDVPMLEYCGYSICPMSADEDVKKSAKEIAPLNYDKGAVAWALKKYILGGK